MPLPTVLVSEPLSSKPMAWLQARAKVRELEGTLATMHLGQARGLVVRTYTDVTPALLDQIPSLEVVGRAGVGLDNIDLEACQQRNIRVVHTPDANTMSVVEYVIQHTLTALRSIERIDSFHNDQSWRELRDRVITPRSSVNTKLGIIGFGRIGSRVARAAQALGMDVIYSDLREIERLDRNGASPSTLEDLASECDVITIHVDGRISNSKFFDDAFFAKLRDDSILINASRGFVVDTDAAIEFAKSKPDAKLILDVHHPEPIPEDSALWSLNNVLLTPHIAAGTAQAKEAMSWVVLDVTITSSIRSPRKIITRWLGSSARRRSSREHATAV